jgi:methionine-rich copper-binding protein CopC
LLVVAAVLAVLAPLPAHAHAALVGTDPADGASVAQAPGAVTLEFSEPVTRSEVVLTAPDGTRVPLDVGARDREVTGTVRDAAGTDQRGTWTLAYRVVSADGHPISGTSTFETTTGRTVEQAPVGAPDQGSFLHRHAEHLWWAVGGGLVAVGLIVWPLLRRREEADVP